MFKILKNAIGVLILLSTLLSANTHHEDHNLTDEQLYAFMSIITNFILSDDSSQLNPPTLTINPSLQTSNTQITVEVNGKVGAKVFVNGVEVAIISSNGKISITLSIVNGNNSFDIMLKDMQDNESDILHIDIEGVDNVVPIANIQSVTVDEDSVDNEITLAGTDADGDTLTYSISTAPTQGTVTLTGAVAKYTPNANYNGADSFSFTVNDGTVDSAPAVVSMTVTAINDTPIANIQSVTVDEDSVDNEITLAGTDADGDTLTYSISTAPTQGTVTLTGAVAKYTPNANYNGADSFSFTVNDGTVDSAPAVVNIDVMSTDLPLVIIRIEFNDYTFNSDATTWHNKIFGNNPSQLNHYFDEISYGQFQFLAVDETDGTANDGIITIQLNENHPNTGGDGQAFLSRITSALTLADPYIDFSPYDTDGNGAIAKDELQIMFLVAGGESATGGVPGVWAHKWSFYGGNAPAPTHDGVLLMNYVNQGNYSKFGETQFGNDATIGVIAHELGHAAFSLPDLYDTNGGSEGIGYFGLMGSGSWGRKPGDSAAGETPVHMTSWSKIQSGFITASTITSDVTNLDVKGTTTNNYETFKIETGTPGEYFLIENRPASGYDMGLTRLEGTTNYTGGLLILHIDDNQNNNQDETHKMVDVEEATNVGMDNEAHQGHINNLYFNTNIDTFDSTTTPNTNKYDGTNSGVSITNISGVGETMTVDIDIN